jgi:uncharacterized protein DUF3551
MASHIERRKFLATLGSAAAWPLAARAKEAIMRTIALVSASLVMTTLAVTDAGAASNRWCSTTPKRSENCGYATLDQCRAYVLGLGGWCRPNPFPGTAFGTSGTWSSGPPRQNRGAY